MKTQSLDEMNTKNVFTGAMDLLGWNLKAFLMISVIWYIPVFLLKLWVAAKSTLAVDSPILAIILLPLNFGAQILFLAFAFGALTYGFQRKSSGRIVTIEDCWGHGLILWFPVFRVVILQIILVGIGIALFLVPGLVAICALLLAVPAMVNEDIGVFASLRRSVELTNGFKLRIFVILLTIGLGYAAIQIVVLGIGHLSKVLGLAISFPVDIAIFLFEVAAIAWIYDKLNAFERRV